jgi:hypothetical protein
MTDDRAARSDSADVAVDAMAQAARVIGPPPNVTIPAEVRPYFDEIVAGRAPAEWSTPDLLLAVNLARCFHDVERISAEVRIEGDTVTTARGGVAVNPKHSLLEVLSRRSVALMKMLHLHAQARNGRPEEQLKKRGVVEAARGAIERATEGDEDDLLA